MKISLSPYVFQMNPVKTLPESIDLKPDWVHYLTGYIAENLWGKKNHDRLCGISSLPLCTGAVGKQEESQPDTKNENPNPEFPVMIFITS